MNNSVKFVDGSNTRLKVLAIPFGGLEELDGKDLDNEFFSKSTNLCSDWYPVSRPLLYEHGLRPGTDVAPVGKVDSSSAVTDEVGVWVEAELDRQGEYFEHIRRLVEQKRMFASSGAMSHLVRRGKNGHIDRWPWVELSLTPIPANPLATVEPAQAKAHYKAAGITPPPTIDDDDTRSYSDLLDRLTDDVGDFTDMTLRLAEGRLKVGRSLSEVRRRKLTDLLGRMRDSAAEIEGLLAETAPAPAAAPVAPDPEPEPSPVAEDAGTEGKAAHAPPELVALFDQIKREREFYAPFLAPPQKR
jgi:hypothetical protein